MFSSFKNLAMKDQVQSQNYSPDYSPTNKQVENNFQMAYKRSKSKITTFKLQDNLSSNPGTPRTPRIFIDPSIQKQKQNSDADSLTDNLNSNNGYFSRYKRNIYKKTSELNTPSSSPPNNYQEQLKSSLQDEIINNRLKNKHSFTTQLSQNITGYLKPQAIIQKGNIQEQLLKKQNTINISNVEKIEQGRKQSIILRIPDTHRSMRDVTKGFSKRLIITQDDRNQDKQQDYYVDKQHFKILNIIGKGGFGNVCKVQNKKTKIHYAMKEMSKAKILAKKQVKCVLNEQKLLSKLDHPFICNLAYSFQDRDNLYLVMDFQNGGDLRYHLGKVQKFNEIQSRFFLACVIIALEHLHKNKILHRDIKPENLVIDTSGYVKVTDLGISRILRSQNNTDISGTPGYMVYSAPEVMCRQNHSYSIDYFAVGIMGYEFMYGQRPYLGKSRKQIREQILAKQVSIKPKDIPAGWSWDAADFINAVVYSYLYMLLQRKPINRLGLNSVDELKNHPWYNGFPWDRLLNKELHAPYIPSGIQIDSRQIVPVNFHYNQDISSDHDSEQEALFESVQNLKNDQFQNQKIFLMDMSIISPKKYSSMTIKKLIKLIKLIIFIIDFSL